MSFTTVSNTTLNGAVTAINGISNGNIQVAPTLSTGASSIGFHYRNDRIPVQDGDLWRVVVGTSTARNLAIQAKVAGALTDRMAITPAGVVTTLGGHLTKDFLHLWLSTTMTTTVKSRHPSMAVVRRWPVRLRQPTRKLPISQPLLRVPYSS